MVTDVRLDYETISNYTLLVVVNDSIHWSSVELEVMVTDTIQPDCHGDGL